MEKQWYKHSVVVVLLHGAAWLLLFIIPYLILPTAPGTRERNIQDFFRWESILPYVLLVGIFYFNAYWLTPRLLNRKKYWAYLAAVTILLVAGTGFQLIKRHYWLKDQRNRETIDIRRYPPMRPRPPSAALPPFIFPTVFAICFVLAISNTYRFFLDKLRSEKIQQQRETEQLKSELSFLRSQISPHFIFNVLNTVVSLSRSQPSMVEPTLLQLSGIIRYMLYDTEVTRVSISQEIEYIEAYVSLQRLRFGDQILIEYSKQGVFFGYSIEPMLLIPFIENAFKHGLRKGDSPYIAIKLEEQSGALSFSVKNRYNPNEQTLPDKYSGIGMTNVKKRLDLLYGSRYNLSVMTTDEYYEAKLKIPLQ